MKNDETRIEQLEQLIQSKSFQELSDSEKQFVLSEFESGEQYDTMRKLTPLLDEMVFDNEEIQPRPSTLGLLRFRRASQLGFESLWSRIFGWKVPAYAMFLVVGFCCVITWWIASSPVIEITEKPLLEADTVYVASKPDTIFKEKIVYRFVKTHENVTSPKQLPDNNLAIEKDVIPVGVSMKDKEELEKLLVSGSR